MTPELADVPDEATVIAKLANEYATIWLQVDRTANSPRLVIHSLRDHGQVQLDPMALALLCHADDEVLALLADIAKDAGARGEFHAWMQATRERQAHLTHNGGTDA
jgi:hypothetical protein